MGAPLIEDKRWSIDLEKDSRGTLFRLEIYNQGMHSTLERGDIRSRYTTLP